MRPTTALPVRLLAALAVLTLVLVACDDDAGAPPPQDPPRTPADPDDGAMAQPAPPEAEPDPDPTGEPAGGHLDYVALGDSLATGAGAATSYVEEFADLLRDDTGAEVEVTNFAVDGWTSADLLASLRDDDGVQAAVADADLVTVDIGGNDLLRVLPAYASGTCGGDDNLACLEHAADQFSANWSELLDELLALREGDPDGVLTMDLYQPFGHDDRLGDDLDRLRPFLAAVNDTIVTEARARDVRVAEVFRAFHGDDGLGLPADAGLISVDGLHPSNEGHRLIADTLLLVAYG
jgi:lysophospholipase L1-like esterase